MFIAHVPRDLDPAGFDAFNKCSPWAKSLIEVRVCKTATVFQRITHFFCYLFSSDYSVGYRWAAKNISHASSAAPDANETNVTEPSPKLRGRTNSLGTIKRTVPNVLERTLSLPRTSALTGPQSRNSLISDHFSTFLPQCAEEGSYIKKEPSFDVAALGLDKFEKMLQHYNALSSQWKQAFKGYIEGLLAGEQEELAQEHLEIVLENYSSLSEDLQDLLKRHIEDNFVSEGDLAVQVWKRQEKTPLAIDFAPDNDSLAALRDAHLSTLTLGKNLTENPMHYIHLVKSVRTVALEREALSHQEAHWIESLVEKGLTKACFVGGSLGGQFISTVRGNHLIKELVLIGVKFDNFPGDVEAIKELLDRRGKGDYEVVEIQGISFTSEPFARLPGSDFIKTLLVDGIEVPLEHRQNVLGFLNRQNPVAFSDPQEHFVEVLDDRVEPHLLGAEESEVVVVVSEEQAAGDDNFLDLSKLFDEAAS